MPKKREYELVQCRYFRWTVNVRHGVWQADGRSNSTNAGRHSLGTRDREEALRKLHELDEVVAANLDLAPRPEPRQAESEPLLLEAGRKLYEQHIQRPQVVGGLRKSTQKRYRTVFDKSISFAKARGIFVWNRVTSGTLDDYASHLEKQGYAPKTLRNELTTLVQTQKWLIREKHLVGVEPLRLSIRKQESERAYCYTPAEVQAMIDYCRERPELACLGSVICGLACTGLRIAELASLRWSDIDLVTGLIKLTDESGRPTKGGQARRQLKSGKSRSIPIHSDLAAVLSSLPRNDMHVFHGSRGGRLKPDTIRQALVREVITPLASKFPSPDGEKGFKDGRLHSFRHFFVSTCANNNIPERVTMTWLGHQDSAMVRHYYHLHDEEARRQMARLDPLGSAGKQLSGHSKGAATHKSEDAPSRESSDEHRS